MVVYICRILLIVQYRETLQSSSSYTVTDKIKWNGVSKKQKA